MVTTYNTAVTEAASEVLEKNVAEKTWVTRDVLVLFDER